MALLPGNRLGPYQIVAPIGAGGMGQVYRARDTRLDRTVAIKVLLPSIAADPEIRARFEREARAISALDHPHICTLYDVGEDGGVLYLVMQHLEGETLAARLAKTPGRGMPVPVVLEIATPIADALDKAHRAGITHRDLKPANIMLTKAGATLLDFGVAKLRAGTGAGAPDEMLTRAADGQTARGTMVGTVEYMAPEQIEGNVTDARSDIFAFGAVVYEMVTGARAFPGASAASVIGAILKDQPPPVSTSQPLAPRELDAVIRQCLEKDPENRWQSARDVVLALRQIAKAEPAPAGAKANWYFREALAWTLAGLLTIALIAALWLGRDTTPPAAGNAQPVRFVISPPGDGIIASANISPDGRTIALAIDTGGRSQLWVRAIDDVQLRPLGGTEEVTYHFWSPDGRAIGFFAQGKLKTIDVARGTVNVICGATNARGGTWGADRTIVFAPGTGEGLSRVSADAGTPVSQTSLSPSRQESSHRWPVFLPDGRRFIYLARSGTPENTGIYVGSIDSSEVKRVVQAASNAAYAPEGFLLFMRGTALIAQPFDVRKLAAYGEPATVADRVSYDATIFFADFSVSGNDTVLFNVGDRGQSQLVWLDRRGAQLKELSQPGALANISLSPDDRRVAVSQYASGASDVWLFDEAGTSSRLTFASSTESHPVWSPDGQSVLFSSDRKGSLDLYRKAASGGNEDLVLESPAVKYPSDWSRDGSYIVYESPDPKTKLDIWMLPLTGDRKPVPFLQSQFDEWHGRLSPDGRWMAYTSNESGRYEIYVQSFPKPGATWQVSTQGGLHPRWRRDQKELYFIAADQKLVAVPIVSGATFGHGVATPLFDTRIANVFAVRSPYAVSADGQRFLVTKASSKSTSLTVVANWTKGLQP